MLRRQLEDEVLLRTELENRLQTAKDDLDFSRRSHNNQMEELRRKRQIEMTSFSDEVEHRYQAKLQEQLQAMRADFDNRSAQSRAEVSSDCGGEGGGNAWTRASRQEIPREKCCSHFSLAVL